MDEELPLNNQTTNNEVLETSSKSSHIKKFALSIPSAIVLLLLVAICVGAFWAGRQSVEFNNHADMIPTIAVDDSLGNCQIYSRKETSDKSKRKQMHPTREGSTTIELKFMEGSEVRLRNNKFTSLCGADLSAINSILDNYSEILTQRLFTLSEEELAQQRGNNSELADLNLWYSIRFPEGTPVVTIDSLIDKLNEFEIVEIAYPVPLPALPPG